MKIKKFIKPTKMKLLFALGLFFILGSLKIISLENFFTHEIYKVSLFNQYKFQYEHLGDNWYKEEDKFFWPYALFLHLIASYIFICVSSFIVNRLRGRD